MLTLNRNPQKEPSNTKHSFRNLRVLETLLANSAVKRLSGVANSAYKRFCPGMYSEYQENDEELRRWKPSLRRNFPNTVFAATTFNLGPYSVTDDHTDHGNYGPGGCVIGCAGPFDDLKGGELVLWTLGIILRFPAATSVIINSALIHHSNLPIQLSERRYSVTQYSAGALFRFRSNSFRNDIDRLAHATPQEKEDWKQESTQRWRKALKKFRVWI